MGGTVGRRRGFTRTNATWSAVQTRGEKMLETNGERERPCAERNRQHSTRLELHARVSSPRIGRGWKQLIVAFDKFYPRWKCQQICCPTQKDPAHSSSPKTGRRTSQTDRPLPPWFNCWAPKRTETSGSVDARQMWPSNTCAPRLIGENSASRRLVFPHLRSWWWQPEWTTSCFWQFLPSGENRPREVWVWLQITGRQTHHPGGWFTGSFLFF